MNLESAQNADVLISTVVRESLVSIKKGILRNIQEEQFAVLDQDDAKVPLDRVIEEMAAKLQKDDEVPMTHAVCNPLWIQNYVSTLKRQENALFRIQQLYFELAFNLADLVEARYAA
jgi:hypothetical protein